MPTYFKRKTKPTEHLADFLQCVRKTDECWIWTGASYSTGYGRLWNKGRSLYAHRISWELHNGKIPGLLFVLHKCDNPMCVNPAHLFLGTPKDNSLDMVSKNRQNSPVGNRHRSRTKPESVKRGESCNFSKLTSDDVLFIRSQPRKRGLYERMAKKYKMHPQSISDIINGINWKHLLSMELV